MKLCFWRKNFTNCFKVRVKLAHSVWTCENMMPAGSESGPNSFCVVWRHKWMQIHKHYTWGKFTPWAMWGWSCGRYQVLFHLTLSQLMVTPVAPLYQVFVTSIPPQAELHTDIYKLDWPACSLALFKTGLGFFLVISLWCSPRQQVFSCQSRDKIA